MEHSETPQRSRWNTRYGLLTLRQLWRGGSADDRRRKGEGLDASPGARLESGLLPSRPMVDPATRRKLESEAEVLAASQLDLLAQIEAQLRAVHHLMRRIEPLRARSGGQPSEAMTNGERADTLTGLSGDLEAIEQQLSVQLGCCEDMLATIAQMRQRLPALKQAAGLIEQTGLSSQDDTDT